MNIGQINVAKKILIIYWLSVLLCVVLFLDSSFGQKYVLFGGLIFLIHVIETFLFDKLLQEHSDNVLRDKFLMLPFGFVTVSEVKLKAKNKQETSQ